VGSPEAEGEFIPEVIPLESTKPFFRLVLVAVVALLGGALAPLVAQQPAAGQGVRQLGTVKAITSNTILLASDADAEVDVGLQETTRLLRIEPGQTDLKMAVPMDFREIQVGDRLLVRGKPSDNGKTIAATMVVAIKKEAIEQKQAREREDWQKRGLGGLVKSVDPATRSITITTTALAGSRPVVVHLTEGTILRRYAPHSVRFSDSRIGQFEEIRPGDQFRGRGARSADGSEFTAEEIITGSFRNIAGTIASVDASASTMTVFDVISKQAVVVRLTPETSLHVLPPAMAEAIAMRIRGTTAGGNNGTPPPGASGQRPQPAGPPSGAFPGPPPAGWQGRGPGGGVPPPGAGRGPLPGHPAGNGPQDFQSMIARLPEAKLAEFPKGDAVMIVATPGEGASEAVAINVVGGVDPLLRAAPEGSQEMMLSSWSLGGGGPEGGGPGAPEGGGQPAPASSNP
jgi:hypothetical protein